MYVCVRAWTYTLLVQVGQAIAHLDTHTHIHIYIYITWTSTLATTSSGSRAPACHQEPTGSQRV